MCLPSQPAAPPPPPPPPPPSTLAETGGQQAPGRPKAAKKRTLRTVKTSAAGTGAQTPGAAGTGSPTLGA